MCGGCTAENFSLCLSAFVVRLMHPDFTTKAKRLEDEREMVAQVYP